MSLKTTPRRVLCSEADEQGNYTEVFITKRSTTSYDKDTVFKVVPLEDIIKFGLVNINHTAVRKYEELHSIDLKGTAAHSNPFLAARKK